MWLLIVQGPIIQRGKLPAKSHSAHNTMILQKPTNLFIQGNTGRHTHSNSEILLRRHCEQPFPTSTVRVGVFLGRPPFCSRGATFLPMFPISPNLPSRSFFLPRNLCDHIQGAWRVTFLGDIKLSLPDSSWCYFQVSEGYIILFCFPKVCLLSFYSLWGPVHWVQWFNNTGKQIILFMYLTF